MRLTKDNLIALKELFIEARWVPPCVLSCFLCWFIEAISGNTWGSILIAILVFPIFILPRFWLFAVNFMFYVVSPILIVSIVVSLYKLNILAACGLALLSSVLKEIRNVIIDTYDLETIVELKTIRCGYKILARLGGGYSKGYRKGYDQGYSAGQDECSIASKNRLAIERGDSPNDDG